MFLSALSMVSQTPHKADVEHTLFDPSNLVERKFFTGSSEEICSYLNKYFINDLVSNKDWKWFNVNSIHEGAKTGQPLSALRPLCSVRARYDTYKDI